MVNRKPNDNLHYVLEADEATIERLKKERLKLKGFDEGEIYEECFVSPLEMDDDDFVNKDSFCSCYAKHI